MYFSNSSMVRLNIGILCVANGSSSGFNHVLLNELGVRGCACVSQSELTVCMKKLHRRDPTEFLSRDVCGREDVA